MTSPATALTLSDCCDRCGSQAYVSVAVKGLVLLFCEHHGRQYAEALAAVADTIARQPVPVRKHTGERNGAWNDGTRF
jgi:hypothetical protein